MIVLILLFHSASNLSHIQHKDIKEHEKFLLPHNANALLLADAGAPGGTTSWIQCSRPTKQSPPYLVTKVNRAVLSWELRASTSLAVQISGEEKARLKRTDVPTATFGQRGAVLGTDTSTKRSVVGLRLSLFQ